MNTAPDLRLVDADVLATLVADAPPVPAGDLHSLTDTIAAELGATVLVTDDQLRVLAHSVVEGFSPDVRDWIVTRIPPAELRDRLPARGRLLGVGQVGDLLTAPGCTAGVVRAESTVLGAVWAFGDDPDPALLRLAARRAASFFTAPAAPRPAAQQLRAELLQAALAGGRTAKDLASGLDLDECPPLLAFRVDTDRVAALADLVALHVEARTPTAAVTRMGDRVYVFGPGAGHVEAITAAVQRGMRSGTVRCAVACETGDLAAARTDVDRLSALPGAPAVAEVEDQRSRLVLAELTELAAGRDALRRGPVARLAAIDADQQTSYLQTLRAYLETGLDLQQAANDLYIHRNTLRYRLDRIRTLSGLDLADPVQRLVADLQLRVHHFEKEQS